MHLRNCPTSPRPQMTESARQWRSQQDSSGCGSLPRWRCLWVRVALLSVSLMTGVSWIPSSSDRPSGIMPFLSSAVHVSSPSSVDPPEGALQHEGRSANQAGSSVVSGGLVVSGILVSARTSLPGSPSPTTSPFSRPHHGCVQFNGWGAGGGPLSARGVWSSDHVGLHINFLELHCFPHLEDIPEVAAWNIYALVQMDSTTVMNRIGGNRSRSLD